MTSQQQPPPLPAPLHGTAGGVARHQSLTSSLRTTTSQPSIDEIKLANMSPYSCDVIGTPSPTSSTAFGASRAHRHGFAAAHQQPQLPTKRDKKRTFFGGGDRSRKSSSSASRDRSTSTTTRSNLLPPTSGVMTARCVHCDETFRLDENARGSCADAPDTCLSCVNAVTCLCCAQGLVYHCVTKEHETYEANPYSCDSGSHGSDYYQHHRTHQFHDSHGAGTGTGAAAVESYPHCKKWCLLTVLTLFVPCLWCYCLLRSCHRCGVACGCCGGRHSARTHDKR